MRNAPTTAGTPITPQGSGDILAGVLRACGWLPAGRSGAKIVILAPAHDVGPKRVTIRGCVLEVQERDPVLPGQDAERPWRTVRKVGALTALAALARAGDSMALFFPNLELPYGQDHD